MPFLEEGPWNLLSALGTDEVFTAMDFLTAKDLVNLAGVSRACKALGTDDDLWKNLFINDFSCSVFDRVALTIRDPKNQYKKRIEERQKRIQKAAEDEWMKFMLERIENKKDFIQKCLDFLHIKLYSFLSSILLLMQVVFVVLRLDNVVMWSVWLVLLPLWTFTLLNVIVAVSACSLYKHRGNQDSLFHNLWHNFRGVAWFFAEKVFGCSARSVAAGSCLFISIFLFFFLLAVRLSSFGRSLPFNACFAPAWLAFLLAALTPCLRHRATSPTSPPMYIFLMLAIWVPNFVFAVLLAARLGGRGVSLPAMFAPYWAVDGVLFLFAASVLGFNARLYHRQRRLAGQRDRMREHALAAAGAAALLGCLVAPLLAFEAGSVAFVDTG